MGIEDNLLPKAEARQYHTQKREHAKPKN